MIYIYINQPPIPPSTPAAPMSFSSRMMLCNFSPQPMARALAKATAPPLPSPVPRCRNGAVLWAREHGENSGIQGDYRWLKALKMARIMVKSSKIRQTLLMVVDACWNISHGIFQKQHEAIWNNKRSRGSLVDCPDCPGMSLVLTQRRLCWNRHGLVGDSWHRHVEEITDIKTWCDIFKWYIYI